MVLLMPPSFILSLLSTAARPIIPDISVAKAEGSHELLQESQNEPTLNLGN